NPITRRPASTTIPWIALVPLISGVWRVFGTFEITAKPMNPASTRIARLVTSSLGIGLDLLGRRLDRRRLGAALGGLDRGPGPFVDDLAVADDRRAGDDRVVPVERELAVVAEEQLEQGGDVAGIQL